MRTAVIAIIASLITAVLTVGIMNHVMEARVFSATVDAFNDGFMDGACRDGMDGFGHICKGE